MQNLKMTREGNIERPMMRQAKQIAATTVSHVEDPLHRVGSLKTKAKTAEEDIVSAR